MTPGYNLERLRAACEDATRAAAALSRHKLPDWLTHRVEYLRGELHDFINATNENATNERNGHT